MANRLFHRRVIPGLDMVLGCADRGVVLVAFLGTTEFVAATSLGHNVCSTDQPRLAILTSPNSYVRFSGTHLKGGEV